MSSPVRDRLFRGYGPLVGFTAVFLAVAVLVPSQQREVRVEAMDESSAFAGDGEEHRGEADQRAVAAEQSVSDR